jgi:hypothetical protein
MCASKPCVLQEKWNYKRDTFTLIGEEEEEKCNLWQAKMNIKQ